MNSDQLTPDGEPPSRGARWCSYCRIWIEHMRGRRRCDLCHTAVVRQPFRVKPRAGELRPGIVAEFADPRDRYDASHLIAELRARHVGRYVVARTS